MPAEAIALDLYVDDLESDTIDQIRRTVSQIGFQSDPHNEPVVGGVVNFQPFEDTEENRRLVEECVEKLETKFPTLNVSHKIRENRDVGSVVAKRCDITISGGN